MLPIAAAFERFGDRVMIDLGGQKETYASVAGSATRMARHLDEMPQGFVVCDATDVARYISVFCACVLSGKTVVPFSTLKLSFDDLREALPDFVYIDDKGGLATHEGKGNAQRSKDDVYCLFTSGTTGKPKGILVNSGNLASYVEGVSDFIPEYRSATSISAVFSPLFDLFYHDLLLALSYGLTLQVPTPREKMMMAEYVAARPIDVWFSTPTVAANILAARNRGGNPAPVSIPLSLFCGERLGAGLALDWAAATQGAIINVYGPTETTIACTGERLDVGTLDRSADVSIGAAFGANRTEISPHGTLVVRGPQVARYLHSGPVEFFDTKDLVSEREGKLYFHGRADGQLKIKGLRIEKEELERIACGVPGVQYAKIQPITADGLVTGFNVMVVGDANARAVSDAYKNRYGAALVPSGVQFVEEFATGTSGKAKV